MAQEYKNWLNQLDGTTKARVTSNVDKFIQKGRGDKKKLDLERYENYVQGEEMWEIRIGNHYRVYFEYTNPNRIRILLGGHKSTQEKDISEARKIRDG